MEFVALETLDHAKALTDCVYAVYGLTFHRDWVYDPAQLLELNRRRHIRSFLALEGSTVQGHIAWIRPFFELTHKGEPVSDARTGEVGLSIVRPESRSQNIQTQLARRVAQDAMAERAEGAFMKCVTNHVYSQKTALRMGASPLAMFLAGVPRWVVYDQDRASTAQPISTVVMYTVFHPGPGSVLRLPPHLRWMDALVRSTGLPRMLVDGGEVERGETELEVEFQPAKRLAQVHVVHPGEDLVPRVRDVTRWLLGGHMEHVTVYLPADSARVQRDAEAVEEAGLFPAGWIPALHRGGRDVLVYQATACESLDADAIAVHGEQGGVLRDRVLAAWRHRGSVRPPRGASMMPGLSVHPR